MPRTKTVPRPRVGGPSPWGMIDSVEPLGEDILFCSTPSHGGYWVPAAKLADLPATYREYALRWSGSDQWYEEDCAWAAVCLTWPHLFDATAYLNAIQVAQTYFPKEATA